MKESGMLHFYFHGDGFTRLVRDLMMEGRWRLAFTMVMEGLVGINYEQTIGVLRGDYKFEGRSDVGEGMNMLPDNPKSKAVKDYHEQLTFMYGCRIRAGRNGDYHWYEPYGYVRSFNASDIGGPAEGYCSRSDYSTLSSQKEKNREWGRRRTMYYANNPFDDIPHSLRFADGETFESSVLFQRCDPPPLWWNSPRTPQESLDAAVACGRYIVELGATVDSGTRRRETPDQIDRDYEVEDDREDIEPVKPVRQKDVSDDAVSAQPDVADRSRKVMAKMLGDRLPEGMGGNVDDILEAVMGDGKILDEPPVADKHLASDNGIIMPDGTFYPCKYMGHRTLNFRIMKYVYDDPECENPEMALDKLGCVRITCSAIATHIMCARIATPEQKKVVANWKTLHSSEEELVELDCLDNDDDEEDGGE